MNKREISVFFVRAVLIMVLIAIGFVGLNLMGCGADEAETGEGIKKLTGEEQKDLARFVEYVFFPTSPYVDKSWVETNVPEEEVAEKSIDFAAETAAIQQVYTEVYSAYNEGDIDTVLANLHPYGFKFHIASGSNVTLNALSKVRVRSYIEVSQARNSWGPTPLLTEFYIRRGNISTSWPAASAKGFNSIYARPNSPGVTYVYLVKQKDKWLINQLATNSGISDYKGKPPIRQYFDNPKYKAPE